MEPGRPRPRVPTEGTIYPILGRLTREGLLEASWVDDESPHPRKYYRLTRAGEKRLDTMTAEWRAFAQKIGRLLAAAPKDTDMVLSETGESRVLERIIAERGPPLRVAQAYSTERIIEEAVTTGRFVPMLRATWHAAVSTTVGFAVARGGRAQLPVPAVVSHPVARAAGHAAVRSRRSLARRPAGDAPAVPDSPRAVTTTRGEPVTGP